MRNITLHSLRLTHGECARFHTYANASRRTALWRDAGTVGEARMGELRNVAQGGVWPGAVQSPCTAGNVVEEHMYHLEHHLWVGQVEIDEVTMVRAPHVVGHAVCAGERLQKVVVTCTTDVGKPSFAGLPSCDEVVLSRFHTRQQLLKPPVRR